MRKWCDMVVSCIRAPVLLNFIKLVRGNQQDARQSLAPYLFLQIV